MKRKRNLKVGDGFAPSAGRERWTRRAACMAGLAAMAGSARRHARGPSGRGTVGLGGGDHRRWSSSAQFRLTRFSRPVFPDPFSPVFPVFPTRFSTRSRRWVPPAVFVTGSLQADPFFPTRFSVVPPFFLVFSCKHRGGRISAVPDLIWWSRLGMHG